MTILHNILRYMARAGLNEGEFCNRAELSSSAVSEWKRGKTRSYMRHLPRIAAALNVSVDDLLREDDKAPADTDGGDERGALVLALMDLNAEETRKALEYVDFLRSQRKR